MDLKELEYGVNPDVHWYYQSKIKPLISFTKKLAQKVKPFTIVDVGAGSGFFSVALNDKFNTQTDTVYLVDIGYTAEEIAETKDAKIKKVLRIPDKIENSIVIMMDVLEHLDDDLQMLKDIKQASVGENNYFFITVPAFNTLWSPHDEYLGHRRRYRIATIRKVLGEAGYTTTNTYYLYGALFPLAWIVRKLNNLRKSKAASNMKPANSLVNSILLGICSAESKVAAHNKMFGISCIAEGRI